MSNNLRFNRWVDAAHSFNNINELLFGYIQGLGKIDKTLSENSNAYIAFRKNFKELSAENAAEFAKFTVQRNDDIILAQLWVMGCYEIIRTLDEYFRNDEKLKDTEIKKKLNETKIVFERVRIPIAKLQKPSRKGNNDLGIALPGFTETYNIAWLVKEDEAIGRDYLSEIFLQTIEITGQFIKNECA